MKVTCPKCKTRLVLPDEKLRAGGMKFKCSRCGATLAYKGKAQSRATEGSADPKPLPDNKKQHLPQSRPPVDEVATALEAPNPEADRKKIRQKKTGAADEISRDSEPPGPVSIKAVLIASGAALFIIVLTMGFLFRSHKTETAPAKQAEVQPNSPSATPGEDSSRTEAMAPASSPGIPSEMTDERAIELVKKSVESTVNKWAAENSGKYSIIGWQAKKMDEQSYLVSYLARAGDKTTGFHFALDVQTGTIQDIANNWDLQKKYNIQYGSPREAAQSPHLPEGR